MGIVITTLGLLLAYPDPLVAEVVAGHRPNLQRIRTLLAVYTTKDSHNGEQSPGQTLQYFRDLNGVLVRDGVAGKTLTEYALFDDEVRRLMRAWPNEQPGTVRIGAARLRNLNGIPNHDLWRTLGGTFVGNDLRTHDLATVLAESDPPAAAARVTRDGVPLVKVTTHVKPVKGPSYRNDVWFDPARGYMPVRSEATGGDGGRGWVEWAGHTRLADGVWLPTHCTSEISTPHGTYGSKTVVTELKVNEPLPGGGTALPLPAGTNVKDELRGTEYKGNLDWTPAGPEKKWQPLVIPKPAEPGPYTAATTDEPTSQIVWLLYAAGGVLATGLVGLAARRLLVRRAGGRT